MENKAFFFFYLEKDVTYNNSLLQAGSTSPKLFLTHLSNQVFTTHKNGNFSNCDAICCCTLFYYHSSYYLISNKLL